MKKYAGMFLLLVLLAAFTGCQKEEARAEKPVSSLDDGNESLAADYTTIAGLALEPGTHIAVVVQNPKLSYWKAVEKGISQAVDELNLQLGYTGDEKIFYTYEGPDNGDAEVQINMLDAVLAENPQVLCLAAIDMNSCEAQLETAQENGIAVIILDSGVKSDELVYTICETDNYSAGAEAARKLCEKIGDTGKVQIVAHQQNAETRVDREAGFRKEIAENHPGVQVLDTIYQDGEVGIVEGLKSVLELHPDLKGVFTTSEVTGTITLQELANQKIDNLQLVGFDAGEVQLEAIRNGKQYGVICQNPSGMGYATTVAAARAVLQMENDTFIDVGYQWIDAANIDEEKNQKYLYQ